MAEEGPARQRAADGSPGVSSLRPENKTAPLEQHTLRAEHRAVPPGGAGRAGTERGAARASARAPNMEEGLG